MTNPQPAQPRVLSEDSIGTLVCLAIARSVAGFVTTDPLLSTATDADTLHDIRVAVRRLRSYLRTFRSLFDPGWASMMRSELGWFGALLGSVRNLDVIGAHIAEQTDLGRDDSAKAVLLEIVESERSTSFHAINAARETTRFANLRSELDVLAYAPPLRGRAFRSANAELPGILLRPWRDVRGAAEAAGKVADEAHLHRLRIRAKELRYAADVAASHHGRPARLVVVAATRLQDRLGSHRDALATAEFLERTGHERDEVAFLAGRLVGFEQLLAEQFLVDLGKNLRDLRRRWHQLQRAIS